MELYKNIVNFLCKFFQRDLHTLPFSLVIMPERYDSFSDSRTLTMVAYGETAVMLVLWHKPTMPFAEACT